MKVDTTKGKFAFYFWGVLFFLLYFKIFAFAWDRWIYGSFIPDSLGILAIILIVIPAAFLTARLIVIKIPLTYHMIGMVAVVLLFSWNIYDDHREKDLADLITYQASSFRAMNFISPEWRSEEAEPVEEMMKFLSQYRVKKMKDSEWNSNVSGERGFHFMVYLKDKTTGASIYENRVLSYNQSSYYKVLNGPIDMKWIDSFKEKYGQSGAEDNNLENEQQDISYSFTNLNTGQEFTIIHAYLLYENYFEAVKENPDESFYKLYQQEVVEPVYEACFQGSEFADSASVLNWVPRESEIDDYKIKIKSMNKNYLNEVFEESLVKSSDILPSDKKTTVCVFPENKRTPSEMLTIVETGNIIVFHSKPDLLYKAGMAHEYHHSVWVGKHYNENDYLTGLDYLILEGQAVMFETVVYPNLNSSYLVNDERFNKEHWSKIEPYLDSVATPESIDEMIQGSSNGLPNYYGYSEGYKMVRSYLNLHPGMTVEEWTYKSSKEIFEEGNYIANYQ